MILQAEMVDFIKGGAIPTLLLGVAGWVSKTIWKVIKNYIDESKAFRIQVFEKIDGVKETLSSQDKKLAVMDEKLDNHIGADEKVQKHIDESISEIKNKL